MNLDKLYEKFHGIKQHGFVCPLFFLKTKSSSQIGEFPDLKVLADFAKKSGFSIIQLLPVFDTGSQSSPYSSRTCYGLNPIYLSLSTLEGLDSNNPLYQKLYAENTGLHFNYEDIYAAKMALLRDYVSSKELSISQDSDFLRFIDSQKNWLNDYSAYCTYRSTSDDMPELWDIEYEDIEKKHPFEVFFHKVLQYFCHKQLKEASDYIQNLGLYLMGDIPILLAEDSVEMWTHRELFDFTLTVGAPPDQFSKDGQAWGFPLIRFVAKPQACAQFWRDRINHLEQYFSLYRIDHAVGFFRLWAIPRGRKAKYGFFFPGDDELALNNARKLFEQLFKNSSMTPIAEDLGVIPDFVKKFISDNKLCGTKVVRWERYWDKDGSFIPFEDYPLYSMATLSTHDTTFMFEEWSKDTQGAKKLSEYLHVPYQINYHPSIQHTLLQRLHAARSLFVINMIEEYLYLYPGLENKLERINDPSLINNTNWSTQLCVPLEDIISNELFMKKIETILKNL